MDVIKKNKVILTSLFLVAMVATGCGSDKSIVKDVNLRTYEDNGDGYVEFTANIDSGAMQFPIFDIPVQNPDDPGITYGRIWMYDVLPSGSQLGVSVNLNEATGNPYVEATLPNGSRLPIAGIENAVVLAIPVSNKGIKVYAAFAPNVALLGAAIPIREFDNVARNACPVSLLPTFRLGDGIRGIAGVFTGCEPGQSGVAVFIDAGPKLFPEQPAENDTTTLAVQDALMGVMAADFGPSPQMMLLPQSPESDRADRKLKRGLYKLNKNYKGRRLNLN